MTLARPLRFIFLALIVVSTIGCDQVTKQIARTQLTGLSVSYLGGGLQLGVAHNAGGFLSLGASLPDPLRSLVFVLGTAIMLSLIVIYLWRGPSRAYTTLIAAALVGSGGLSNLLDRILWDGYVTDFIVVGWGWLHSGVFNVADLAIVLGGCLLAVSMLQPRPEAAAS